MTYDRMSTYLTWGGTIGSTGLDRWQCGLHLALAPSTDGPGLPTIAELTELLSGTLVPFHTAAASYVSPGAFISWAKAASMDNAGHYTAEPVYANVTPVGGGAPGTNKGGPQLSACFTLWSGATLGRANYGRFYAPWCEAGVGNDGRILAGLVAPMLGEAKTMIDAVNSWATVVLSPSARITIMSKEGTGASKRPQYIRLGDVKDTQQRRRRQIPEQYSVDTVTA